MIATLISGHDDLSDWSFLLALVAFVVAVALVVLGGRLRPSDGTTGTHAGTAVAVLPLVGWALVALGLLVI